MTIRTVYLLVHEHDDGARVPVAAFDDEREADTFADWSRRNTYGRYYVRELSLFVAASVLP